MLKLELLLIDRIISLLDKRSSNLRTLFKDYLEPLYTDMTQIHLDYKRAFSEVELVLIDKETFNSDVWPTLRNRERELLHLRLYVFYLAKEITRQKSKQKELQRMSQSILSYFTVITNPCEMVLPREEIAYKQFWYVGLLGIITMSSLDNYSREAALEMLRDMNSELDSKWEAVTAAFAEAKVSCLG